MANVSDIMTRTIVAVRAETSLLDAAEMIEKHGFDGLPVTKANGELVGILTQYDLISNDQAMHLPTLQKIIKNLNVDKRERSDFAADTEGLVKLTVADVMNTDPLTLRPDAPLFDVIAMFRDHHRVNPVPVIDEHRHVVGLVSRYDIIKLFAYVSN